MSSFDYDQISLGIRDLVRELREEHQMDTIDSGDGSNFVGGMECAIPERHVFMEVAVEDMNAYQVFVIDKLSVIPGIGNVQSSFVMEEIKSGNAFTL